MDLARSIRLVSPLVLLALACSPQAEERQDRTVADTQAPTPSLDRVTDDTVVGGPETLSDSLCRSLNNDYQCGQAIEKHLLAFVPGVVRRGGELIIHLLSGDSLSFRDSTPEMVAGVRHTYRAHLSSVGYHVVDAHYYEGGTYLLVNARTGKSTFSNGVPVASPDGRRVAAANVDLEAEYSPTTVQIWRVEGETLVFEWEHDFLEGRPVPDSNWGPADLRWLTPAEIRFTKQYPFGEKRGEGIVRLGSDGWGFVLP